MIFFTADTHFHHRAINDYCKRGFSSIEEMNESIISNWNDKVRYEDTVYHLGDFGLSQAKKLRDIREKLNGRIILIEGNHDSGITRTKWVHHVGIDEMVERLEFPEFYIQHHPPPKIQEKWTLCGHVHDLWKIDFNLQTLNVGVDMHNFTPLEYSEVLNLIYN